MGLAAPPQPPSEPPSDYGDYSPAPPSSSGDESDDSEGGERPCPGGSWLDETEEEEEMDWGSADEDDAPVMPGGVCRRRMPIRHPRARYTPVLPILSFVLAQLRRSTRAQKLPTRTDRVMLSDLCRPCGVFLAVTSLPGAFMSADGKEAHVIMACNVITGAPSTLSLGSLIFHRFLVVCYS